MMGLMSIPSIIKGTSEPSLFTFWRMCPCPLPSFKTVRQSSWEVHRVRSESSTLALGRPCILCAMIVKFRAKLLRTAAHVSLDWDIVQAISYHQPSASVRYIATATSEKGKSTYVKIWKADGWKCSCLLLSTNVLTFIQMKSIPRCRQMKYLSGSMNQMRNRNLSLH